MTTRAAAAERKWNQIAQVICCHKGKEREGQAEMESGTDIWASCVCIINVRIRFRYSEAKASRHEVDSLRAVRKPQTDIQASNGVMANAAE